MNRQRRTTRTVAPVCALFLAVALAGSAAAQDLTFTGYRIGPLDLLEVVVVGADDLGGELRVSEAGTIAMQLVGEVPVAGLTTQALAADLRTRLSTYIREPEVSVYVREYKSYRFSIMGAINSPGVHDFAGPITLLEALALAGGVDFESAEGVISVLRADASQGADIDVETLFEPGSDAFTFVILPGDVVHVRERKSIEVYVYGQVMTTGPVRIEEPVTLLKAISMAGGVDESAATNRVRVVRTLEDGEQEVIQVDLDDIHDGERPDVPLQAGDVVLVPKSFFG